MKIKKNETYADFLKRIRYTNNLTQADLALRFGFARSSICAWESGNAKPRLSTKREIDRLAKKITPGRRQIKPIRL